MRVIYERCAGMDVHKKTVVVCLIVPDGQGGWRIEVRTFATTTGELLKLADWLRQQGVTHVAMESTGVYWKPVYNLLEGEFEVMVVNAKHIKFVPGRKTDVKDAQWIAELLQHGLLKASLIPSAPQRELRELVRYRIHLVEERSREMNRVHKVLEDANLKLSSVASDVLGVSGREMLAALIAGQEDPAALAQLAKGRLRQKIDALEAALTGRIKDSHRRLLSWHLRHIDDLNALLDEVEQEVDRLIAPFAEDDLLARLATIPGVDRKTAQVVIAELGVEMSRFPTAAHAASWAGLVPGKHESAGRNYSAKTNKANRYLRAALVEAAHAAGRSKNTYLAAQYRRLAARRGKKRAAVAVAHSLIIIIYHIIQRGTVYVDLGSTYFDQRQKDTVQHRLVQRLQNLGYKVSLEPLPEVA
jgi:transposase